MKKSHLIALILFVVAMVVSGIYLSSLPANPQGRDIEEGHFSFSHYSDSAPLAEALRTAIKSGMSRSEVERILIGQGGASGNSHGTLADQPQDSSFGFGHEFDEMAKEMPKQTNYILYMKFRGSVLVPWTIAAFYDDDDRLLAMVAHGADGLIVGYKRK